MMDQLTCEETFRQLDDFIDRELSEEDCRLVQKHLDICTICSKEFNFEADVWKEVRTKLKHTIVPPNLRESCFKTHLTRFRILACFNRLSAFRGI